MYTEWRVQVRYRELWSKRDVQVSALYQYRAFVWVFQNVIEYHQTHEVAELGNGICIAGSAHALTHVRVQELL